MLQGSFKKISSILNNKKIGYLVFFIIIILGVLIRIILQQANPDILLSGDGKEYKDIALQISRGNGFSISYYRWYEAVPDSSDHLHIDYSRTPIFPLLGAGLFFLPFEWDICAKVILMIFSVLCALSVYLLTSEVFQNKKTGLLAVAVYMFYPYSLWFSIYWISENVFLFFICMAWYFLVRSLRRDFSVKDAIFCGGFLACASMTRPQGAILFLVIGLLAAIPFFVSLKKDKVLALKIFKVSVAFCVTALLFFAPWMIRNAVRTGIPSPFSFYGAYSFAQASSDMSYAVCRYIDTPEYNAQSEAAWNKFHQEKLSELKKNKIFSIVDASPYWRKWAWEYIRENPGKMMFIIKKRLAHCFRLYPNAVLLPGIVKVLFGIYFAVFYILFLGGVWCAFREKNKRAMLLLLPPLMVPIMAIPFFMLLRYRYPFFAPFASAFVAYFIYIFIFRIFRKISDSDAALQE